MNIVSTNELIGLINRFSLAERIKIIEEVLKTIREEETKAYSVKTTKSPSILKFAGILDEKEASIFEEAIEESRKIDEDEW